MVGPTVALMRLIFTPKLSSTSTMRFLLAVISSMSTTGRLFSSYFFRSSNPGFLYLVKGSSGLIGVFNISSIDSSLPLPCSTAGAASTVMSGEFFLSSPFVAVGSMSTAMLLSSGSRLSTAGAALLSSLSLLRSTTVASSFSSSVPP